MLDLTQNYFALFGLPLSFAQDLRQLESSYRDLVAQYHPDRFADASDAEKRQVLQAATQINAAYQVLKSPLARGRYLLQLQGVDTQEETNTAMPVDFLMNQMEWREAVAEAQAQQNVEALEKINQELRAEISALEAELGALIDQTQDYPAAAMAVRKLKFLDKLDHDIGDAIEAVLF